MWLSWKAGPQKGMFTSATCVFVGRRSLPPDGRSADRCCGGMSRSCLWSTVMATCQVGGDGRCCTLHRARRKGACLVQCLNEQAPNPQPPQPLPAFGLGSAYTPSWSTHHPGTVVHPGAGDRSCRRNWATSLPASGWQTSSPTPSGERPRPHRGPAQTWPGTHTPRT